MVGREPFLPSLLANMPCREEERNNNKITCYCMVKGKWEKGSIYIWLLSGEGNWEKSSIYIRLVMVEITFSRRRYGLEASLWDLCFRDWLPLIVTLIVSMQINMKMVIGNGFGDQSWEVVHNRPNSRLCWFS